MKAQCLQENLIKGLNIVKGAVASKSTLPNLEHVLIKTDGGRLRLAATNLEMGLTVAIGAKVEGEGGVTVPAKMLVDLVKAFPKERVYLQVNEQTATLKLVCEDYRANVKGMAPSEFPTVPTCLEGGMEFQADALVTAVGRAAIAAAGDESRPILTGVLFKSDGNEVTLAAADGFRLSVSHMILDREVDPFQVVVPAKAMTELVSLSPDYVGVQVEENRVVFDLVDTVLSSQLIDGGFPDYGKIIPNGYSTRVTVGTKALEQALKSVEVFARDVAQIAVLEVQPSALEVSAQSAEMGDGAVRLDAMVEGDVQTTGEPLLIAFNVKYLLDGLGVLGKSQATLDLTTPSSPGLLHADGFQYVIMPMHLGR